MVRFEWDEKKNQSNLVKHGIDFQTAQLIFDDPNCVTFLERSKDGEPRWHAISFAQGLILLVVAYLSRFGDGRTHPHNFRTPGDSPRKEDL